MCVLCVREVGRALREKTHNYKELVVSPCQKTSTTPWPSLFLLSLFTFLFRSHPRGPDFFPISWFNCRDQQTYGRWAVARKCYIFVKTRPDVPAALPNEKNWRKITNIQSTLRTNTVIPTYFFLNLIISTPAVSVSLSLPSLVSSLIKMWEVFSSITRALLRFHFTSSPGRLYAKAAQCQAILFLPTHPLSCRLLNNAICRSPLTRAAPFTAWKKARNAVRDSRRVYATGREYSAVVVHKKVRVDPSYQTVQPYI